MAQSRRIYRVCALGEPCEKSRPENTHHYHGDKAAVWEKVVIPAEVIAVSKERTVPESPYYTRNYNSRRRRHELLKLGSKIAAPAKFLAEAVDRHCEA